MKKLLWLLLIPLLLGGAYKVQVDEDLDNTGGWTSSGTNIYPTTITDNVGIGFTAPLGWLQVGTSPSAPILIITKGGNVGIGATSPTAKLFVTSSDSATPVTAILGEAHRTGAPVMDSRVFFPNEDGIVSNTFYTDGSEYPYYLMQRAKGTQTVPLTVANLDDLGSISIQGYDGTGFIDSAAINFIVDNTVSSGTVPGAILFVTSSNLVERMRITSAGNVGIGTTAPLGLLQVGTSPNAPLIVEVGGSVGIGTTNPSARLEIVPASTTPAESLYINVSGSRIILKSPDGTCSACGTDNADAWSCVSVTCP